MSVPKVDLTISIPSDMATRIEGAFATAYGWQEGMTDTKGRPVSQRRFVRMKLREFVREVVASVEANEAAETARQAAVAQAAADLGDDDS